MTPRLTPNANVTERAPSPTSPLRWDWPSIDLYEGHVYILRDSGFGSFGRGADPVMRIDGTPAEVADWFEALARAIRANLHLMACPDCGRSVHPAAAGVWESDGVCDECRAAEEVESALPIRSTPRHRGSGA